MNKAVINSFWVRLLSGLVLLVAVLLSLLSQYSFVALIVVVAIGAVGEFNKMVRVQGYAPLVRYSSVAVAAMIVLSFLVVSLSVELRWLSLLLVVMFLPFAIELYRKKENPIANISFTLMGIVYVGVPLSLLMWIGSDNFTALLTGGELDPENGYNAGILLSYIAIVWANDVGAYLVGITIGRRRLFERISPKKSWEGFYGGLIAAVALGMVVADIMEHSMLFWGGLGLIIALSGVFGDLVESLFKRSAGIKDSGAIMPGHGGFLDRFDALIYSAPFVFVYFVIFTA